MALKPIILIEPTTLAVVTPQKFVEVPGSSIPATVMADGLAGAETVTLHRSVDNGVTSEIIQQEGAVVTLTETDNTRTLNSPLTIGATKLATVAPVGVVIASEGFA